MRRTEFSGLRERGTILLVVLFIAVAIAALAAISAGRVVAASGRQAVLERESQALVDAYATIHMGLNVVNNSAYDDQNHNLEIRNALATPATDPASLPSWLADPSGVTHGLLNGTGVRVYRARDYIKRLAKLKGETPTDVDPYGESGSYFVLEALGHAGDTLRVVSALVRENEPFSSFVFFQNQHTLGISGQPRGLIHTNNDLAFYFPNGRYIDTVSAVNGFQYRAGATPLNTAVLDGNPSAAPISIEAVDFNELRQKAGAYVGQAGLDAEIKLYRDGKVRISPHTKPHWEDVQVDYTQQVLIGYEDKTYTTTQQVQVGTTTEERTRQVIQGYTTETYTVEVPVYEEQTVTKTRQVPIYETQTVTKTRWVKVFVPYDGGDASGGTTVGDSGDGVLGEYVWVEESYETTEQVIVGYTEEQYTVTEQVQVGTTTEERTREVPVYTTETYTVEVPVYETQEVTVTEQVPVYDTVTKTRTDHVYQPPVALGYDQVFVNDIPSTIFIDGRITKLGGELNGRLTIIGTEKVRVTDSIRYVDDNQQTAMLNGSSMTDPYVRNPDYTGSSVLGVIARGDIVFTRSMPDRSEVNATLMTVEGRVGTDGIWLDPDGNPFKDSRRVRRKLLTPEQYATESDYDRTGTYRTRAFVKNSLRRLGGIISNKRIIETYIRSRKDGTAYVAAGFKRGSMRYDFNLNFNPPPNFVEIPRPVVTAFVPVLFMRDQGA